MEEGMERLQESKEGEEHCGIPSSYDIVTGMVNMQQQ